MSAGIKISDMTPDSGSDAPNEWFEMSRDVSGTWSTFRINRSDLAPPAITIGVNEIAYGDGAGAIISDSNFSWDGSQFNVNGKSQLFGQFGDSGLEVYTSTLAPMFIVDDYGTIIQGMTAGLGGGGISTNTAYGYQALIKNSTGDESYAGGYQALKENTTGQRNVAIGAYAATANTTGGRNVAIGWVALGANQTSEKNVAIGYAALGSHTSGDENVAIGYLALQSGTSGQQNLALGSGALLSNTSGNTNVALGANAMANNTTGSDNTAIGYASLRDNNGTDNVAIGKFAMYIATSAAQNVVIGDNAGTSLTSQANNVIIGYNAFQTNNGGDCTVIGRGISLPANGDGQMVLGAGGVRRIAFDGTGALKIIGPAVAGDAAAVSTHSVLINVGGTDYYFMVHT